MTRKVTEADFRLPEFRDANLEDYEFRKDGKVVRKDRWEVGFRSIVCKLGMAREQFEIDDVVAEVERLVKASQDVSGDSNDN